MNKRNEALDLAAQILEAGGWASDAQKVRELIRPEGPELVFGIKIGDGIVLEDDQGGHRMVVTDVVESSRLQVYVVALTPALSTGPDLVFRHYKPGDTIEGVHRDGSPVVVSIAPEAIR